MVKRPLRDDFLAQNTILSAPKGTLFQHKKKNDKPKIDEKEYLDCYNYNEWIKTNPCGKGLKRNKLFAKLKSNTYIGGFGTYLWRMFSGEITPEKHKEFVKVLKKTFTNNPVFINNTDVDWFHIKEKI